MIDEQRELRSLRVLSAGAEIWTEAGGLFVFLPNMHVMVAGQEQTIDALLRPWKDADGYTTRLFYSRQFSQKGQNWNVFNIKGKQWHSPSWNDVPAELPWLEIVANHLGPLS